MHAPRVALRLTVDDEDVFGLGGTALSAQYGRLASLVWLTFSDCATLLNHVDNLEILVSGVQFTVTELELIIAHYTIRGAVGAAAAQGVETISVDVADRPPLRSLKLDSKVMGPLPLYQLLRSPLLESLDMLELCTTQTSGSPEHFHAPLDTWMDNVTRYMPKLRVLRLGGVIAHDADTVIPDHQELGDGPNVEEVELHVTGDISQGTTRNGDINRAHAVSRWMKRENPVVRIALADQDSEMKLRDYTATLGRFSRYVCLTSLAYRCQLPSPEQG